MSSIDWTGEMRRTWEWYLVDPASWQDARRLGCVKSATLTFDKQKDTFGNGSFELLENIGEAYIRTYIIAAQGRRSAKAPVGTFLVQASQASYGGKAVTYPAQAFTPLIELSENMPPIGYYAPAGADTLKRASDILVANGRAPVSAATGGSVLTEAHVAGLDETYLEFASSLAAKSGHYLGVDPYGRIVMFPEREPGAMQPVQVLGERNSTVVPDVTDDRDMFKRPNVYEAVLSRDFGSGTVTLVARATNDNPASPLSVQSRGRVIPERNTSPDIPDGLSQSQAQVQLDSLARRELAKATASEHTLTIVHPWMPHVSVGVCVYADFPSMGATTRAVVESQTINCDTGGLVTSKAVFSEVSA